MTMTKDDVKKFHEYLDERTKGNIHEKTEEFVKDQLALDLLNDNEGWQIIRRDLEDAIFELLTPVRLSDKEVGGNVDVLVAINEARAEVIDFIKNILAKVEGSRKGREAMQAEEQIKQTKLQEEAQDNPE